MITVTMAIKMKRALDKEFHCKEQQNKCDYMTKDSLSALRAVSGSVLFYNGRRRNERVRMVSSASIDEWRFFWIHFEGPEIS